MLNKNIKGFHSQNWLSAAQQLTAENTPYVLVTVLAIAGSTPREQGCKMVVTENDIYATIGGGHLEFKVIEHARKLLAEANSTNSQALQHFNLAASLGQCCGGTVSVLFEAFCPQQPLLQIYGAGHIAQALVPILSQLPFQVQWIDSRAELLTEQKLGNVQLMFEPYPTDAVATAPANSYFLVLTHNHQLDFELIEKILRRNDAAFVGLIGSKTKAKRFQMRLQHKGVSSTAIEQLHCPVGLPQVAGKLPMEIAISIAGQLIQHYKQQQPHVKTARQGVDWQQLKPLLKMEPVE